jgi:hypothetical protein
MFWVDGLACSSLCVLLERILLGNTSPLHGCQYRFSHASALRKQLLACTSFYGFRHTSISKKFSGMPYISSKLCVCGLAPVLAKPVGMNCCGWPWPCCCCWACDCCDCCCGWLVLLCEGCSGRGSMRCILGEVVAGVHYTVCESGVLLTERVRLGGSRG